MLHDTNTDKYFHNKEGQPRLSCSNKVGDGCPSLVPQLTTINFSPGQIKHFIEFAKVLKRIHIRLVMEGHKIEDGKIYKLSDMKSEAEPNKQQPNKL